MKIHSNIMTDNFGVVAKDYTEATKALLSLTVEDNENINFIEKGIDLFFCGCENLSNFLKIGCGKITNPIKDGEPENYEYIEIKSIPEIKEFIKEIRIWCDNTENIIENNENIIK